MLSFLFGVLLGYTAWGNDLSLTFLSLTLFMAYLLLDKRLSFFLLALGYYGMASRGLLIGAESFVGSSSYALVVWSGAALFTSFAWIAFWSKSFHKRLYLFPLALLLIILPPVGLIGWVNPLPTIAVLMPNFGWMGLVGEMGLVYGAALLVWGFWRTQRVKVIVFTLLLTLLLLMGIHCWIQPKAKSSDVIKPIHADLPYKPMGFDRVGEYRRVQYFFRRVQEDNGTRFLLPENALGNYSDIQSMVWGRLDKDKVVYAGADIYNAARTEDRNVLLRLDYNLSQIIYTQRVPVLFTMWKPFTGRGTVATLYQQPVIELENHKVGVFICYEQLLTFPYLQTMFYEPDILLGISNLYWAKGTNIGAIQYQTMELWAILFGVPLVVSVNG